jgi:MoaF N-terminal domain/MoaF C-terminal domain
MRELKPIQPLPPIRRDMDLVANRLPPTTVLAGETIRLEYPGGSSITMAFTPSRVRWSTTAAGEARGGDDGYEAVEIRPGVFFIDFALSDGSMAFSHVVDRDGGRALTVWSEIVTSGGKRDLRERVWPARPSGHSGAYDPICETRELLGKRLFCEYSPEAALEHIYVNSATIVWQWLRSPPEFVLEVGIEAVTMWKIQDRLYLISTRGEDPIQLTLLLDLAQMRNVGRLFGRGSFGIVDRRCGAKITWLGEFTYPKGYGPG